MDPETPRHDITKKRVVYQLPDINNLTVKRDIEYQSSDTGPLRFDIYYPADVVNNMPRPAVIFVIGYSDIGAKAFLGCNFKEMESFISWAELAAASGLIAITYTT